MAQRLYEFREHEAGRNEFVAHGAAQLPGGSGLGVAAAETARRQGLGRPVHLQLPQRWKHQSRTR